MASAPHSAHGHSDHSHGGAVDDGRVHVHIAPVTFYVGIFLALIFLTFVTVKVSYFDFGAANAVIAVLIATMKAGLVAAFFMHLNHDKIFHTIILLSSILFLLIFVFFTSEDVSRRGQVDPTYGGKIYAATGEHAPGGMPIVEVSEHSDKKPAEAPKSHH